MKPSFKTTTLIAAIGMTIAAGFVLTVTFLDFVLGIDLYVHPVRMQGLWSVHDVIWWSSVLVFFWGLFRYPDQLPKHDKLSKAIAISTLAIVGMMLVDRLWVISSEDPQWLHNIRFVFRFVTHGGYLAALWGCYGKSSNEKSPNAMRYSARAVAVLSAAALIVSINSDFAWWFEFPNVLIYASYYQMAPFYHLLFACIAACILIGLYDRKPNTQPEITNKDKKRTKRILCAGWILLGIFIVEMTLVLSLVDCHSLPEWLEMTISLFIFAAPLIAGIYLIIACRALRKAYDMLEQSSMSDNQ